MKDKVFKEEMKRFNISIDDIKPTNDMFGAIEKAIIKMRNDYFIERLEVILNDNLIDFKDKITNYRTILGCRVSYDNLPINVSFIIREDKKPSYERLEEENERLHNIIKEVRDYIKQHSNNAVEYLDVLEVEELLKMLDKENKE